MADYFFQATICGWFLSDLNIGFEVMFLKHFLAFKWISIRPLDNFLMNLTHKKIQNYIIREKTKSIDGSGFCPNAPVTNAETLYYVFPAEL